MVHHKPSGLSDYREFFPIRRLVGLVQPFACGLITNRARVVNRVRLRVVFSASKAAMDALEPFMSGGTLTPVFLK